LYSDSVGIYEQILPNLRALTLSDLALQYCLLESISGLTQLESLSMNSLCIDDYKPGFTGNLSPQLSKLALDRFAQITTDRNSMNLEN